MKLFGLGFMVVVALLVSSCTSSSGVVPFGPGVFTVVKGGKTGFSSLATLKTEAYKEANDFAVSHGKQIEIISVDEKPAGFGKWPQVEVRFRLLDKKPANSKTPIRGI
jgi:hypothetical protein